MNPGRKKAVCFVDDNPHEIRRFRKYLKDHFIIGAGTSISEALTDLEKQGCNKPDLFILDLYFPDGPRNTEDEIMELCRARESLLDAESEFITLMAKLRLSSHGGLKLANDLRERWGASPFIYFTRKGTLEDSIRGLKLGALKVLKKPDPNKREKECKTVRKAYDLAFKNNAGKIAFEIEDAIRTSSWWWRNKQVIAGFMLGVVSSIVASVLFNLLG